MNLFIFFIIQKNIDIKIMTLLKRILHTNYMILTIYKQFQLYNERKMKEFLMSQTHTVDDTVKILNQETQLQEEITRAVSDFTDQLNNTNESLAEPNCEKSFILRNLMKEHWHALISEQNLSPKELVQEVFLEFERLGLPYEWFRQCQTYVLHRCTIFYNQCLSQKKIYIAHHREEIFKQLEAIQTIVMNDLADFYYFFSTRQIENLLNDKKYLISILQKNILNVINGISSSGNDLTDTTKRVLQSSQATYSKAVAMVSMSEQFSQNVSSVSEATQNLSTSIDEIAAQLSKGALMTRKSAAEAKKAQEVVQTLSIAAQKIGEVVKIINEIATQTNLLALNATIEAARSGAAGKGFSVVASEVKNLAGQTAKATDEITLQIQEMQDATQKVVTSIKEMTSTISDINDGTSIISAAVNEQGSATQEIFRSIAHVANSSIEFINMINQLKHFTGDTGNATQETINISTKVTNQSHYLKEALQQIIDFMNSNKI